MAENAAIDSAELAGLHHPDVTVERLREVAFGITTRIKDLPKIVQGQED